MPCCCGLFCANAFVVHRLKWASVVTLHSHTTLSNCQRRASHVRTIVVGGKNPLWNLRATHFDYDHMENGTLLLIAINQPTSHDIEAGPPKWIEQLNAGTMAATTPTPSHTHASFEAPKQWKIIIVIRNILENRSILMPIAKAHAQASVRTRTICWCILSDNSRNHFSPPAMRVSVSSADAHKCRAFDRINFSNNIFLKFVPYVPMNTPINQHRLKWTQVGIGKSTTMCATGMVLRSAWRF